MSEAYKEETIEEKEKEKEEAHKDMALEKEEACPNNPEDCLNFSPLMCEKAAKVTEKEKEEEELVVTNPKLASLIYHSFNMAFVLEVIFFFGHIVVYHRSTNDWWQVLLCTAIASPLFIAPLYFMPILRDVFVKAYAMAPCDIHSTDSSNPLIFEKCNT